MSESENTLHMCRTREIKGYKEFLLNLQDLRKRVYFVSHCQYEFPDEDSVIHMHTQTVPGSILGLFECVDHRMPILLLTHLAHCTLQGLGDNLTVLGVIFFPQMCVVRGLSRQREDTPVTYRQYRCLAVQSHSRTSYPPAATLGCAMPDALQSHSGTTLGVQNMNHLLPQAFYHLHDWGSQGVGWGHRMRGWGLGLPG